MLRRAYPLFLALFLHASPTWAADVVFAFGPMGGAVVGPAQSSLGLLGGELTFVHYVETFELGVGGFLQASTVGFERARFSVGPQVNFSLLGAEVGAMFDTAAPGRSGCVGVHLAPFVSSGYASLAIQTGIPVVPLSEGPLPRWSVTFAVTLKLPISVKNGPYFPWDIDMK
ncbi:hypothetical protein [Polyangium aurulentum]|uniref:hypothetical protein n=1 Tax=Polyangium aurulentum TaxID=2567896 RepID=UPI0010AE2AF3|nr:hypothetical protein [Polyangium aurulentum]UQA56945.1 hypothetical protein E8A73_037480 [Polyangium aurulentum]